MGIAVADRKDGQQRPVQSLKKKAQVYQGEDQSSYFPGRMGGGVSCKVESVETSRDSSKYSLDDHQCLQKLRQEFLLPCSLRHGDDSGMVGQMFYLVNGRVTISALVLRGRAIGTSRVTKKG